VIGTAIGVPAGLLIQMTAMPEMVALLNGFGGIASLLLGWSTYHANVDVATFTAVTIFLSALIGGVTFSGSIIAWGKLKGLKFIPSAAVLFPGQKIINSLLLVAIITLGVLFCLNPGSGVSYVFFVIVVMIALVLGVLAVIPIGGGPTCPW